MRPADLTPPHVLAQRHSHGTRVRYIVGCRCAACRKANSRYENERQKARRRGDTNGLVSTAAARKHVRNLGRRGVGYKTVADCAKVSKTVVADILFRGKAQIRARTERAILAVDHRQLPDSALVSARSTWRLIAKLLDEGFSKAEIARRMGYKSPALQFRKDLVTVKTRAAVQRIYWSLTI